MKERTDYFWTSSGGKVLLLFFVLALAGSIAICIFVYSHVTNPSQNKIATSPTTAPASNTPSPTPISLSQYSIKVLNGSGTNGQAAAIKKVLDDAGYKVSEIGNADTQTEPTLVYAKETVSNEFLTKLGSSLASYSSNVKFGVLQNSDTVDVQITLGVKK